MTAALVPNRHLRETQERVSASIPASIADSLRQYCTLSGYTISSVIAVALFEWISREEEKLADLAICLANVSQKQNGNSDDNGNMQ